jgi:hypothetical protein
MGLFGERKKEPWHLGDVDLSKLEGESPDRAARVRAYLTGGEERFEEELRKQFAKGGMVNQGHRSLEEQQTLRERFQRNQRRAELIKRMEEKIAEGKVTVLPPEPGPPDEEELDALHQDNNDLANVIEQMGHKMGRALATAIQAIHDIEGDDSFESDDLQMAIAYLAALQDPQD